jgi:GxxExxY protein
MYSTETQRHRDGLERDPLTEKIIGAAIEVHRELGPGLLESAYEQCLCHELHVRGISFQRKVTVPVSYKGIKLDCKYKLDLLVEDTVIVELKCVPHVEPVHTAQLLTYLRLTGKRVGLIINFKVAVLMHGIIRRVL